MLSMNTARRIIRMFPKPVERQLRETAWRVIPVRYKSRYSRVYHCCVWKSASQWVRVILSDPRVYRASGLRAMPMSVLKWAEMTTSGARSLPASTIFTPVYQPYTDIAPRLAAGDGVAFFVYRDPRDLLVSRYYSRLSAHPETPAINERRKVLRDMSKEECLLEVIKDFHLIADIGDAWLRDATADPRILLVRYEDLTGPEQHQHWARIFAHCDVEIGPGTLRNLLKLYSFRNITGGRDKGSEDAGHKYRKGEPGDWVNHFTPTVMAAFEARFGNIVERWGYG